MTTCPRCGRVADESVCGTSLALARRAADLEAVAGRCGLDRQDQEDS
jgi:hypothetical protein